jgi:chromosome segregation protein
MERELALSLEHVESGLKERHRIEVGEALHEFHAARPLGGDDEQQLQSLKAAIERMGEVNVSAISELAAVKGRATTLAQQREDLEQSVRRLQAAIVRIDDTSRARFKVAFEAIDQKFQAVFPRLFGGGRASLMLVPGGPGDEPGVEILAQPPGKKLQSVSLLSGGETALTAVALIFAIFLIKPAPFCLLDEVDAPLDEGNVGRYNQIVKDMSSASQFILITHNKRTMEIADALYGVTMQEPGVSKIVSVKIRDAADNSDRDVA